MQLHTDSTTAPACQCGEPAGHGMTLGERIAFFSQAVKRIIGAPDYEAYLARHRQVHPEVPPMSEKDFFRFAIDRRYSKPGLRCC